MLKNRLVYRVCPEKFQPLLIQGEWFVQHPCNLAAKENGLEYTCVNNDDFTVLVSRWGDRYHWMNMCTVGPSHSQWGSKAICIKFCLKLEHSSAETIQMIQKVVTMATGDWQLHHDNAPAQVSPFMKFIGKTSTHPGDSAPLQPKFGTLVTSGVSQN